MSKICASVHSLRGHERTNQVLSFLPAFNQSVQRTLYASDVAGGSREATSGGCTERRGR